MKDLLKTLIHLGFLCLILVQCSSKKPEGKTAAEVLYKEAQELMKESRYLLATEKLNTLKTQYPYSFYATHAELLQADILFLQENFIEAAAAYLLFRDFHPKHEKIVYVVFRIAESYYRQLPSTYDRDLSSAQEAIKYYTEIVDKYGDSEYKDEAIRKSAECNKMLSNKEQYIADFYFKTKVYDAARFRYLKNIQESNDENLVKHSMLGVVKSSYKMKAFDECVSYAKEYQEKLSGNQLLNELESTLRQCEEKLK